MNVTETDFAHILDVAQQAGEKIIAMGEQHAPIIFGVLLKGQGKYAVTPPVLVRNKSKIDLIIARETLNRMLSRRMIDVGIFACESWVGKTASKVEERTMNERGLEGDPRAVSALVIMLYSRDCEHCIINPIDEGPPRKMTRGKLLKDVVGGGRMSMHTPG
jgi:hypothetical protein